MNSRIKDLTICSVPEKLRKRIVVFQRVIIAIGDENPTAIIIHIHEESAGKNPETMPAVKRIIDKEPVINREQYELSERVADHYLASRGDVLFSMVPSGRRENESTRDFSLSPPPLPVLNEDQRRTFEQIIAPKKNTGGNKVDVHLIHGVTGAGKTRIYIELIQEYLKNHLGVIFLVPEIALSYQFLETFKPVFGRQMALLHSGLSRSLRFGEYKRVINDEARLVVGTRSAIFAPVADLGLVILDEEHDSSYKEHTASRYNAKWVAADRLKHQREWSHQLPLNLVLGSATPAVDSMYYARNKTFFLHELKKRATGQEMPEVHIPLHELADEGADVLSPFLVRKMDEHLKRQNQIILILNRRGYNNCAYCPTCETNVSCPHCSVSMTYHRSETEGGNILKCHLCGYKEVYKAACNVCGSRRKLLGKGIQKVEDALEFHFPKATYARMDQDSVSAKGYAEDVIAAMLARRIDILIGTQMIAKGFDIPGVTLVGLLNADIGLSLPDFRSAERVFQLLTQASGRAGRHSGGEVVMQTMQPHHYAIAAAARNDYNSFYEKEIELRREMKYPPFSRLLRVVFRSHSEENLWHYVNRLRMHIQEIFSRNSLFDAGTDLNMPAEILGPVDAPLYKINNEFRVHLLVKDSSVEKLREFGKTLRSYYNSQKRKFEDIRAEFDLDPIDVL